MPFVTPYTDVDFVADYNAANSTDWQSEDSFLVWVPSASTYWLALHPRNLANTTDCPYVWAILNPATRQISGFSDGWGLPSIAYLQDAHYDSYADAVYAQSWGGSPSGYRLTRFDVDGTINVTSGVLDYQLVVFSVNPVSGKLYGIIRRALGWMEFCEFDTTTCEADHFVTIPTGETTGLTGEVDTMIQYPRRIGLNTAHDSDGNFYYLVDESPGTDPSGPVYSVYRSTLYKFDQTTETGSALYTTDDDVSAAIGCYRPDTNEVLLYLNDYSDSSRYAVWIDCDTGSASTPELLTDTSVIWGSANGYPTWHTATSRVFDLVWYNDSTPPYDYHAGGADFDPADMDAEPNVYEVSEDSSVSYGVVNGYANEVWVSNYTYDGSDHYYTRIWGGPAVARKIAIINVNMRRRA